MSTKQIGLIGIGNMGTALLTGVLNSEIEKNDKIIIYDVNQKLLDEKAKEFNVGKAKNNAELVKESKYIILAIKPQVIGSVLEEIAPLINENHVVISIAAGVTIKNIQKIIGKNVGITRVMPNTPALVGEGASVIATNGFIKNNDLEYVKNIFTAVGIVFVMDEKYMDAVTGLSGSGPAYIFIIIEALSDGGVKMGLPRDIALKLAAQTVLGSAKMYLKTEKHPGTLKDMVTSPGGTTIAALHELEKGKLRSTLISAVETATLKSKSLN
ncbi:MAG: pyrroline-5-carboxylate reductase [Promethearchaeota archaeon]